ACEPVERFAHLRIELERLAVIRCGLVERAAKVLDLPEVKPGHRVRRVALDLFAKIRVRLVELPEVKKEHADARPHPRVVGIVGERLLVVADRVRHALAVIGEDRRKISMRLGRPRRLRDHLLIDRDGALLESETIVDLAQVVGRDRVILADEKASALRDREGITIEIVFPWKRWWTLRLFPPAGGDGEDSTDEHGDAARARARDRAAPAGRT